jgi:DNA-binding NarL/FixJ family response regulator
MSSDLIRVLIVDDQPLIRMGLEALLGRRSGIEVVGQANNGEEALETIKALDPDVVLMDIRMPGMDGVEATRQLTARGSRAAVIILTTFQDDENVFSGISAGAKGYLLKDAPPDTIVEAIRTVAEGKALLQPEITNQVLQEFRRLRDGSPQTPASPPSPSGSAGAAPSIANLLTQRERAILQLLAQGQSNQEIGETLMISIGTVKNHVGNILGKLGARDRMQAVLLAQQFGLL